MWFKAYKMHSQKYDYATTFYTNGKRFYKKFLHVHQLTAIETGLSSTNIDNLIKDLSNASSS
jgi:hypothetical protein